MAELKLNKGNNKDVTIISNQFIDQFMCEANGEFVKIYLYLLRCVNDVPKDFSISLIADKINLTENDVLRALKYWEKAHLLTLGTDNNDQICSISFDDSDSATLSDMEETSVQNNQENPAEADIMQTGQVSDAFEETAVSYDNYIPAEDYVPDNQALLETNAELKQVLFITEQYVGRPLNPSEINRIYYFYDVLEFPTDLIEYLVEHCISNGNKNMRYIEKVALAWAEKGIKTVSQAKEESNSFHKDYFTILKAFGIRNRNPVSSEISYMNKWMNNYQFTTDIITEACSRTVQQVGNPSFPYADSILTSWHKKGIIMKKDIQTLDADFHRNQSQQQARKDAAANASTKKTTPKTNNKFNNFDQRTYDYNELEKQLIQM